MKMLKNLLPAVAFMFAIAGAFASKSDLTFAGYRSTSTGGSSCTTYSSIPDNCSIDNTGAQCTVVLGTPGTTWYLFNNINSGTCIDAVKRPSE